VRISEWLKSLPRPVGVLASNDVRGIEVLDACRRTELRVPEQVAVLGVDDDALLCEICSPPLSSISPNIERIGFEAAALLERLMEGGKSGFEVSFVPPLGITTRRSTDVLSVDDQPFATAVRYIRENACHGITVDEVLATLPMSRSTLERRFRTYLGHSPHSEIRAVQLARARQLLAETDHPLHRIAELVGIDHPEYFSVLFKRGVGQTPGEYRRQASAVLTATGQASRQHES
jgi:LacI family transcriptional regulator